jgi:predicted O-methyltransferase YrrM
MGPELLSLLEDIHCWGQDHDAGESDKARKMLNLQPDTARMVSMLVRSSGRKRLLEIGTSNGYSTIWLAWSLSGPDGRIISVDHSAEKHAMADENLRRAGLRERVELRLGDATTVAGELEGAFDFVLFDSVQVQPHKQLEVLLDKLADSAMVLADNVLSHPEEMSAFISIIEAQPDFDYVVVPVGKGLCLAYRG